MIAMVIFKDVQDKSTLTKLPGLRAVFVYPEESPDNDRSHPTG